MIIFDIWILDKVAFEENELELELKEGDPKFHGEVTNLLSQYSDLTPCFQSKYERGVKLLSLFG